MSFRYTVADPRPRGLPTAGHFNLGLDARIEGLTAMDRDQLPHAAVNETMVKAGATHELLPAAENTEIASPYRNNSGYQAIGDPAYYAGPGLSYSNYDGDWVSLVEESFTARGGLIQAEFSTWLWKSTWDDDSGSSSEPIRWELRLLVNGQEVDSTAQCATPWANVHLVGLAVAPEGGAVVSVEWRVSPQDENKSVRNDQILFYLSGADMLIQNRRA